MGSPAFIITHDKQGTYRCHFRSSSGSDLHLSGPFVHAQACMEGIAIVKTRASGEEHYKREVQDDGRHTLALLNEKREVLAHTRDIPSAHQREALIAQCMAEIPDAPLEGL